MSDAPATFQTRLKNIMHGTYFPSMRRSVQTVVLYEADRCLKSRYKLLRPFQRKIALYDCAADLVNTLDWIPGGHKMEVMFRTATGKTPLSPDLAWRRMKLIDRDIAKIIIPGVKPFMGPDKTHQESSDAYIQSQFNSISQPKDEGTPVPDLWEYAHISVFLAYRMYYDGEVIATNLPAPIDPNSSRVVPNKKPEAYPPPPLVPGAFPSYSAASAGDGYVSDELQAFAGQLASSSPARGGKKWAGRQLDDETRRAMLKEVKDHLDVIKQLEGIMPPTEAQQRKRALYAAMPPPPGSYKKARKGNTTIAVPAAVASSPKKAAAKPAAAAAAAAAASDDEDSEEAIDI
mmetsp:Transcript_27342/g.78805  ORF Transcript_27342/g.78805 Transcript_27342/m.78805 type:complete len:346 (-) Transcript_27342:1982-3019(-)